MAIKFVKGVPTKIKMVDIDLSKTVAPIPGYVLSIPVTKGQHIYFAENNTPAIYNYLKSGNHPVNFDKEELIKHGWIEKVSDPSSFSDSFEGTTMKTLYGMDGSILAIDESKKISEDQEKLQQVDAVSTEEASSAVLSAVDEYVFIQRKIEAFDMAPLLKRQEELKKQLQLIAKSEHFPSNKPVQLYGTHNNYVEFSPQANSTKIADKEGLVAAIGIDGYIDNTDITLTAAKKLLSENELSKYTTIVPGARTMKTVHLGDEPSE